MSMTTQPGWYPDPAMPTVERWWDGTAWTAHTRPAATPLPVPGRPGRGRAVALGTAAVVVVAAIVAGVVVFGDGEEKEPVTAGPTAPSATTASASPTPTASVSARDEDPTRLSDQLNGITLPVLKGWEKPDRFTELPTVHTVGESPCPAAPDKDCRHGTVSSRTASGTADSTPETIARADIALAADNAFEDDVLGNRLYGGIRSHKVIAARPAVVAGRSGYLVRWQVTTGKGPGGYVQSLVFPSPLGSEAPVIVRFAFDAGPDGPGLAVMDGITRGILPIGSATGGGVGSSIGP